MAYYYVKTGGTATGALIDNADGVYSSQKTGTWASAFSAASEYFNELTDVFSATDTPTHGDFIFVSDVHAYSGTSLTANAINTSGIGIYIVSVDNDDVQAYSFGAKWTVTADINWDGNLTLIGLEVVTGNDNNLGDNDGSQVTAINCKSTCTGAGDIAFRAKGTGTFMELIDCTAVISSSTGFISSRNSNSATKVTNLTASGAVSGSLITAGSATSVDIWDGCDFSACTSASYVFNSGSWDSFTADDVTELTMSNCKFPSGIGWHSAGPLRKGQRLLVTNSSDTSVGREYQYYFEDGNGTVEEETSIYRDNSIAWPSGAKTSLKCISKAVVGFPNAFSFDLPTRYAELSNTASDTVRVYLACSSTLDDADVWVEVIYPDGTNKHTPNIVYSVTEPFDVFRTPATLTTSTETWFDDSEVDDVWASNEYQIDVDTSTDPGSDCVPIIRVYVARASTTIYFCTSVDVL